MVGQGYTSICESPEGGEVPTRLGDLAEEISSTKDTKANVVLDMRFIAAGIFVLVTVYSGDPVWNVE
jgi:hypothetical protein